METVHLKYPKIPVGSPSWAAGGGGGAEAPSFRHGSLGEWLQGGAGVVLYQGDMYDRI